MQWSPPVKIKSMSIFLSTLLSTQILNIINDCIESRVCYTFWQLPLGCRGSSCSCRRLGLLGANGRASAGVATHHRHCIVITTSLQGIPVGDEGEPAVLSLQCHLERHEALQVHVAGEKWEVTQTRWTNSCIHAYREHTLHTKPGAHSNWRIKKTLTSTTQCIRNTSCTSCHKHLLHWDTETSHPSAWQKNLHSPLVLSHKLGGELAEDV